MRALAVVAVAVAAGCSTAPASDPLASPSTGLVLALHYDPTNVAELSFHGVAFASARRFGPYTVAESAMPSDQSVGFQFDPGDGGHAMICGETHDAAGNLTAMGCGTYSIRPSSVVHDDLTLGAAGP